MARTSVKFPEEFALDESDWPEGFGLDEAGEFQPFIPEPIADPNDVEVRDREVLDLVDETGVPFSVADKSYEPLKRLIDAVPDPKDIILEDVVVPSEKKVQPALAAAEEKKSFVERLFGFRYPPKPPNWEFASPIEKFNYIMLPLSDFLGRLGGKITSDWRITTKEEAQKILVGDYNENLEWYQKSPEMIGWTAEKVAEFLLLKSIFKLSGLHKVLTIAGQKATKPFLSKALIAKGGMQQLKTLSSAGLRNITSQALTSFLQAAPENVAFISSWSALDAIMKGKSPKEVGIEAVKGAGWGAAITAGLAIVSPIARAPEIRLAFTKAMQNLGQKYPKIIDLLGKNVPKEIEKEWLKQYGIYTGRDIRIIDLTTRQRAAFRNTVRAAEKELVRAAKTEQAIRTYWSTEMRTQAEAAKAAAKVAKEKAAIEKPKPPTEVVEKPPVRPVKTITPEIPPTVPVEAKKLSEMTKVEFEAERQRIIELDKANWQMTKREAQIVNPTLAVSSDLIEAHHKIDVERAVEAGKPVPTEVLAEYPDLAPTPAEPTVAKPVEEEIAKLKKIQPTITETDIQQEFKESQGLSPTKTTELLRIEKTVVPRVFGVVGDFIIAPKIRKAFKDILSVPVWADTMGEYRGRFEKPSARIPGAMNEKGIITINPKAIVREQKRKSFAETFYEEVLHAMRFNLKRPFAKFEVPYDKKIQEITAKKGATYWFRQSEKWAQEALAKPEVAAKPAEVKKAKAPIEQLGGVPEEPLVGLTKAEAVHLGKREQTALRAGQKLGLKIGYKKGYQEAALTGRRKLNVLQMDKAISQKSKEDVKAVIQQFVPKDQQYRFMTRLGRVKDAKGVQKLTAEINHFIEGYEHRAAVRHFKTFVSGIRSKYKSGEVAFGQLPDNLRDKVMSVIDAYDAVRLSEAKAEDLIAHKEHIQKVAGSIADAFSQWENLDEQGLDILQLPNYRIRELQRLSKVPVADLNVDEIEFIQNELEGLLATNERKGQIKARIRAEKLHTDITGAGNEIYARGETVAGEIKQPGYARRFAGIEQAQLRTLIGFGTKQENEHTMRLLVDHLYEANRKRADNYRDFIEFTRKQRVKRKITDTDFNNLDKPITVTLGGKEITITQGSLLSLWMDTEAEGNMRRLLTARGHNLRSDKNKPIRVGKISLEEIQATIEKLSDKARTIGELAFDVNFQKQAPALNKTWMELYNYPIARHERHWPFPREIEKLVEGPRAEISLSMEMQGRYQRRTGGNARHIVVPFKRQFMKGLQIDAATAAMTGSMQEAKALLANKKWRSRMRDGGQQPVMNAITTMLRRSQGLVSDQSVADLIAAKFLGKAGRSLLSARPSGMLIQTASISAGYETIEPKYFINLAVPTPSAIKELKELSPTLWLRWEAKQFNYALGAAASQSGFNTLIMGKRPIPDRLVNHYTWGDQIAIYYGWTAAQNKVAAETTLRKGTPEFTDASLDLLHRWLESQPQWDILNRTLLTSHPSPWFRGSMMFMSARNAQYNVLLRSYDDYAKGRIEMAEFSTRVGGVVQANITVSLARRLFRLGVKAAVLGTLFGLSDEEDKELIKEIAKEEVVKDIKKVPLESVLNMFGLTAFGQIPATIGYEAARQIEGKTFPKKLSEARTGNIIADFTMDFVQFGILNAKLAKEIWTQEVYVDRKRMGQPKWKDTATDLVNVTAEIVAQITGLPYSGPRSDIVWPTQTVLRGMSKDEYEKKKAEFNKLRKEALQKAVKQRVKEGKLPIKKP